jgi:hypothetical protein
VGAAFAVACWAAYRLPPPSTWDSEQLWVGARALLDGRNPYTAVEARDMNFPLFYPISAVVFALPLGVLPLELARATWAGVGGALLFLAARRYGRALPTALLSAGTVSALVQGQWSPYLTAAIAWPLFAGIWAAKPTLGLALFAAAPSWPALVVGAALTAIGFLLVPSWPQDWLRALRASEHVPLIFRPGGFVLLLAALRWKQPEARLLTLLACVPQTTALYETVPLFLIPRTRWEGYGLACLSYVAAFAGALVVPRTAGMSLEDTIVGRWPFVLVCLYLPVLLMVLRGGPASISLAGGVELTAWRKGAATERVRTET